MNYGGGFDGGASQFAGTGFMPTQSADAGGASGSGKRGTQNQTLRAVTVRQLVNGLAEAQDDDFQIDGADLHNIALVGKVVSIQDRSAMTLVMVNDGTGEVEVKSWHNDESEQGQAAPEYAVGEYVRVYGHIRTFEKKKGVVSYSIRRVVDFNEITYHFMQCIFQHTHLTKGAPSANAQAGGTTQLAGGSSAWGGGGAQYNGGAAAASGGGYAPQAGGYGAPAAAPGGVPGAPKKLEDQVLDLYNDPQILTRPNGLSVSEVAATLQADPVSVKAAVDFLALEGHLYTTVDDLTFRSTST